MAATPSNRRIYRQSWRHFVEDCLRAARDPVATFADLGSRALDTRHWISPSEDRSETALFGALGPMAYAYARATSSASRRTLAPGLGSWSAALLAILDRLDPPPTQAPPPARSYRADIDG